MGEDIYSLIGEVKGKTFATDLEEQMDIAEMLYGHTMKFSFSKKDIDYLLALDGGHSEVEIYPEEVRERVRKILYEEIRRYGYLMKI